LVTPKKSLTGLNPTWSGPISKRVVIAHGWADDPGRGWLKWLVDVLAKQGIEASAPQFPEPKKPVIKDWMGTFREAVGQPDSELVLVGHSLGCLIVCKYLSDLDPAIKIAGIVLVAGMTTTESWRPEGLYPIDFDKVESIASKRICIYSDDDDKVPPERTKELAVLLDAELIHDPGNGHFAGIQGTTELPSALDAINSIFSS